MSAHLPRLLRITLFSSVLLNVLLLSAGVSWWISDGFGLRGQGQAVVERPQPRDPANAAEREQFRAAMAPHRAGIRARAEALRAARADVGVALRAEPFDPARLEAAFSALRAAEDAAAAASHRMLAEFATDLDGEGRERMAQRIEHRGSGQHPRGGRVPSRHPRGARPGE